MFVSAHNQTITTINVIFEKYERIFDEKATFFYYYSACVFIDTLPVKGFPNALLKLREIEVFVLAFFRKTAENENLLYLILSQNCGKRNFSL